MCLRHRIILPGGDAVRTPPTAATARSGGRHSPVIRNGGASRGGATETPTSGSIDAFLLGGVASSGSPGDSSYSPAGDALLWASAFGEEDGASTSALSLSSPLSPRQCGGANTDEAAIRAEGLDNTAQGDGDVYAGPEDQALAGAGGAACTGEQGGSGEGGEGNNEDEEDEGADVVFAADESPNEGAGSNARENTEGMTPGGSSGGGSAEAGSATPMVVKATHVTGGSERRRGRAKSARRRSGSISAVLACS